MKTETETLEDIRDALRLAELQMAKALRGFDSMVKLQTDPRRLNAAFMARGLVKAKIGELEQAHAAATDLLFAHWPEQTGEIVVMGGGGGR